MTSLAVVQALTTLAVTIAPLFSIAPYPGGGLQCNFTVPVVIQNVTVQSWIAFVVDTNNQVVDASMGRPYGATNPVTSFDTTIDDILTVSFVFDVPVSVSSQFVSLTNVVSNPSPLNVTALNVTSSSATGVSSSMGSSSLSSSPALSSSLPISSAVSSSVAPAPVYTGVQATNNVDSSFGLTTWTGMTTTASYAVGDRVQVAWHVTPSDFMQGCVTAVGTSPLSITVFANTVNGATNIPWTPWDFSLLAAGGCFTGVQATNNVDSSLGVTTWTGMTTTSSFAVGMRVQVAWHTTPTDYMQGCITAVGSSPLSITVNADVVNGATNIPWTPWDITFISGTCSIASSSSSTGISSSSSIRSSSVSSSAPPAPFSDNSCTASSTTRFVLCYGQSNMADTSPSPILPCNTSLLEWNPVNQSLICAVSPMWVIGTSGGSGPTSFVEYELNGGGPCTIFGATYLSTLPPNTTVILYNGAQGAQPLINGVLANPDGPVFLNLINQTTQMLKAVPGSCLDGLLYMQGESDADSAFGTPVGETVLIGPIYEEAQLSLFTAIRTTLNASRMFVIQGPMVNGAGLSDGCVNLNDPALPNPSANAIEWAHRDIPNQLIYSAYSTIVATDTSCQVHFGTVDVYAIGVEMAIHGVPSAKNNINASVNFFANASTYYYGTNVGSQDLLSNVVGVVPAVAYSIRKITPNSVYSGPALRACACDNSSYLDIGFVGNLINSTQLYDYVVQQHYNTCCCIWYDQSGNGNHAVYSTGDAIAPQLVNSLYASYGNNLTYPVLNFPYVVPGNPTYPQSSLTTPVITVPYPQSISVIAFTESQASSGGVNVFFGNGGSGVLSLTKNQANFQKSGGNAAFSVSPVPGVLQLLEMTVNSTQYPLVYYNGVQESLAVPADGGSIGPFTGTLAINDINHFGNPCCPFYGQIAEIIIFPAALTTAQLAAEEYNIQQVLGLSSVTPQTVPIVSSSSSAIPSLSSSYSSSAIPLSSSLSSSATTISGPTAFVLDMIYNHPLPCFSLRQLTVNYTGPAIYVCDTGAIKGCTNIYFLTSGALDTTTLLTFASMGSGTVGILTWYDQSGAGNNLNTTYSSLSSLPLIVVSNSLVTVSGLPAVKFNGGSTTVLNMNTTFVVPFYGSFATVTSTSSTSQYNTLLGGIGGGYAFAVSSNQLVFQPNPSYSATYSSVTGMMVSEMIGEPDIGALWSYTNGVLNTLTPGSSSYYITQAGVGNLGGLSGFQFTGDVLELVFFQHALEIPQQHIYQNSTFTYYGLTSAPLVASASINEFTLDARSAVPLLLDELATNLTASAAYSLRLLRVAYTGYCVRLSNTAGTITQDIGFVNNNLDIDSVQSFAKSISQTPGVIIWYDQSGNGHHAAGTTGPLMPYIHIALNSSAPQIVFIIQSNLVTSTISTPFPQVVAVLGSAFYTSSYNVFFGLSNFLSLTYQQFWVQFGSNSVTVPTPLSTELQLYELYLNDTGYAFPYVNALPSAIGGVIGGTSVFSTGTISMAGIAAYSGLGFQGNLAEIIIATGGYNTTQPSILETNTNTYWNLSFAF